jgi:hypothetical protein
MKEVVSTCVKTLVLFKILPCYAVGKEPEPPEPHQNFHPEPEPETHKNDAAPQHWADRSVFFLFAGIYLFFIVVHTVLFMASLAPSQVYIIFKTVNRLYRAVLYLIIVS